MSRRWVFGFVAVVLSLGAASRPAHAQVWVDDGWGWNGGWNNGGWGNGWNGGGWNSGGWNNGWNNGGWNGGWNNGWGNGGWNNGGWGNGGGWGNPPVPPVLNPTIPGYTPMFPGDAFGNNFGDRVQGGTYYPGMGVVNGNLPARPNNAPMNGPYNPGGGTIPGNGQYAPGLPGNRR